MKERFFLLRIKLNQSISSFRLQGFSLTVVFVVSMIILSINIFNAINRGKFNYDTYVYERQTLANLEQQLDQKIDTYDYVSSDEYKQLMLRDGYAYAKNGQTLYKVKEEPAVALSETKEYLKPDLEGSYTRWWYKLVF